MGAIALQGVVRPGCAAAVLAVAVLAGCFVPAQAQDAARHRARLAAVSSASADTVETVRFADPRWAAVRVVRGGVPGRPASPAPPQLRKTASNTEVVSFGDGTGRTVAVVRGTGLGGLAASPGAGRQGRQETVRFSDPLVPAVSILRGAQSLGLDVPLFGAADGGELDRVAFAVDGAESGHGTNLAMWRDDLSGPQGPMQVTAAAAFDVGGGDRFDLRENRLIGRAYLARLYERYGNWPDAIAAYNWGPGNLDGWIAAGRPVERLPFETTRYLARVLRDAFLMPAAAR